MARYSLILKDSTYVRLIQLAAKEKKTFGKYVNELLNKHVKLSEGGKPIQCVCFICGRKAFIEVIGKGQQQFFVCTNHKELARKAPGYKPILRKDGCLQP